MFTPTETAPLVERLRNTPNWMRESFEHWKTATSVYDRAPFEAADEIERLRAQLAKAAAAFEAEQARADAAEVRAETAQAAERERCAKIVEEHNPGSSYQIRTALAAAIRGA